MGDVMNYSYKPNGVCSIKMDFDIENNIIKDINIIGGCNGNLKGIKSLIIGQDIDYVIEKLKGIKCNNKNTSCPDQIAIALEEYKKR
jgi:uncharacterized protein (TIGR03905 family)